MAPNLIPSIYDALQIGHGKAGSLFDVGEAFLLADNYAPADSNEGTEEILPVFLHAGSGRRFTITVHEIASDTPGDPALTPEQPTQQEPAPLEETRPPAAFTPPSELEGQADQVAAPTPGHLEEEQTGRPSDAIQSVAHEAQPEHPESNVDLNFDLKVAERDAQLQPGEPLPTPDV